MVRWRWRYPRLELRELGKAHLRNQYSNTWVTAWTITCFGSCELLRVSSCVQDWIEWQNLYLMMMFPAEDREHCLIASSVYATDIDCLTVPDDHISSRRLWALSDHIFSICNQHKLPSHSWTWGTHFPPKTGWIVWSQQSTLAKILSEGLQDINHQAHNSHYIYKEMVEINPFEQLY